MARKSHQSLTPIDSPSISKDGIWHIKCLCKCGKEKYVNLKNFRSGHTISCGCSRKGLKKPPSVVTKIDDHTSYVEIVGLNSDLRCVIDTEDTEIVNKHRWYCYKRKNDTYVYCKIGGKKVMIHRFITKASTKGVVDHINHNTLDNRKRNLRICTQQQNTFNGKSATGSSSRFVGVSKCKGKDKWVSYVKKDNVIVYRKYHSDEIAAAKSRDLAALEYFGEFANLNFPITKEEEDNVTR